MPDLFADFRRLREQHPAWRLLRQQHAPFVITVLAQLFMTDAKHSVPESAFLSVVEEHLQAARSLGDDEAPTQSATDYLTRWLGKDCGFIRRTFRPGDDEPVIDLTSPAHSAIEWVMSLLKRSTFVGTESRLRTIIDLLSQVRSGTQDDPRAHLDILLKQRADIEAEIERLRRGEATHRLDPLQVRDRLQQIRANARHLLADLREVDQSFRALDQDLRTRIATWEAPKGKLLSEVFGTSDDIKQTDQGRSFEAFWEYLMSGDRQEEFRELLKAAIAAGLLEETGDHQLRNIHIEWLHAAEQAQNTVGQLSQQLRRFLDDRSRLEHRRIMQIISCIERTAMGFPKSDEFAIELESSELDVSIAMERQLYTTAEPTTWLQDPIEAGSSDDLATALHEQVYVDRAALRSHIDRLLTSHPLVSLPLVLRDQPLTHGLAEIICYIGLAAESDQASVSDQETDLILWETNGIIRQAGIPKLLFWRAS